MALELEFPLATVQALKFILQLKVGISLHEISRFVQNFCIKRGTNLTLRKFRPHCSSAFTSSGASVNFTAVVQDPDKMFGRFFFLR